jgi:hypothetical protein
MKKLMGRPPQIDYAPGAPCSLTVAIEPALKREIVESAASNDRRISDEVALALDEWVDRHATS